MHTILKLNIIDPKMLTPLLDCNCLSSLPEFDPLLVQSCCQLVESNLGFSIAN